MSAAAQDPPEDPPVGKAPAEALALRARPRPIARFRRHILIAGAAVTTVSLAGAAWFALGSRLASPMVQQTAPNPAPANVDAPLAGLPKDYGQAASPRLGPPLPGDLGRGVLEQQRHDAAITADGAIGAQTTRTADAERERIAAEDRQARAAGVMMRTGITQAAAPLAAAVTPAVQVVAPSTDGEPGDQDAKRSFLSTPDADTTENPHHLVEPASPYTVLAGDVIAATLLTGLDSDLPGFVTAQVSQNVYDTVSGRYLLIPQGSRLIGAYDSSVSYGQTRALLVWRRLILPDGASIQLDNLPATDAAGYAGLKDKVDVHGRQLLEGATLSTLLGVSSQLALDDDDALARALRESTQQTAAQAGQQVVGKQLSVQPTLKVRPGWPLRVIVHKDLVLRPWRAS